MSILADTATDRARSTSSIVLRPATLSYDSDVESVGVDVRTLYDRTRSASVISTRIELPNHNRVGVLVHGCHLQAEGWEEIVWGFPPERLGRLPHAVLLGFEEKAEVIVFGTGASVSSDGRLEGQYTMDVLMERLPLLHDFNAMRKFPLDDLQKFVQKVAMPELESKNTIQEVRAAFDIFSSKGLGRAFLVSSPTHLPRCLACALQAVAEDEREHKNSFHGEINASPSETCYHGFEASDVVVVEPPHRGDRDKNLDSFPFHEMVRRTFKIQGEQRESFLKDFEALLKRYDV